MADQQLIKNGMAFRDEHTAVKDLAAGSEGKVSLWRNKSTGTLIAVKEPVENNQSTRKILFEEIEHMKKMGKHPHIVRFLGSAENWPKLAPAIFYEFCELGDVQQYSHKLLRGGMYIPEITMWKFILDMAHGLDYLHNGFDVAYVHGDLKPNNILVSRAPGDDAEFPIMPIFKLADFSHLTPYKTGPFLYHYHHTYMGTYEYGPPILERKARLAPPVDIWAVGASLQTLAWCVLPIKSDAVIKRELQTQGKPATGVP
jgi:serine/threonine protein kinase